MILQPAVLRDKYYSLKRDLKKPLTACKNNVGLSSQLLRADQ